ncbi:GAF domain-containing protein [Kordiimonas sp. SCSIO 12610]|uniref:GAF domain-containing protein n=1 Tax=Kordiimonas sp. SCSIO 12610 TaxID=2829597 RepID=UPI0021093BA5|nr:GAF domain-containing protein [Kordiimonas sp. SCSIO 12610]UTW54585.1 GAF domain-containing protein [Kordiimonas sp. SCSIO 12610]
MTKTEIYQTTESQILAVLEGEDNVTAQMATISCLLAQAFPETFFWTGFYVVSPENDQELVVGPYQGTLGCLRIPFGRGVCGTAAAEGATQIVKDVHAIENHIACDSRTNSEIVVPVFDGKQKMIAVLDVDSEHLNSFDTDDQIWLERIVNKVFAA